MIVVDAYGTNRLSVDVDRFEDRHQYMIVPYYYNIERKIYVYLYLHRNGRILRIPVDAEYEIIFKRMFGKPNRYAHVGNEPACSYDGGELRIQLHPDIIESNDTVFLYVHITHHEYNCVHTPPIMLKIERIDTVSIEGDCTD